MIEFETCPDNITAEDASRHWEHSVDAGWHEPVAHRTYKRQTQTTWLGVSHPRIIQIKHLESSLLGCYYSGRTISSLDSELLEASLFPDKAANVSVLPIQ